MSVTNERHITESHGSEDEAIIRLYNTQRPEFAYICGGRRMIAVDPDDARARKILLSKGLQYYSKVPYFIYRCLEELPVHLFMDIGANYGECMFSAPADCPTRIRGYEANPQLKPYLEKSVQFNTDLRSVEVNAMAVADVAGADRTLDIDPAWSGRSKLSQEREVVQPDEAPLQQVRTTTIDRELNGQDPEPLVLLKIDIQGWEPAAFEGAAQTNKRLANLIYVIEFSEAHLEEAGWSPKRFFDELCADFTIYKLTARGLHPVSEYAALRQIHPGEEQKPQGPTLHLDLVLTTFADNAVARLFAQRIVAEDLFEHWKRGIFANEPRVS